MAVLPKLKRPGLITASATTDPATAQADHYVVAWTTGLAFRNDDTQTAAVTVCPVGKDPASFGLHLTSVAAQQLAVGLANASLARTNVAIFNHRDGRPNVWERFSWADAQSLANDVANAAAGH